MLYQNTEKEGERVGSDGEVAVDENTKPLTRERLSAIRT